MAAGAILHSFTITNGYANGPYLEDHTQVRCGGGVWGASNNAVVLNCVLTGNAAASAGGGAYNVTLKNCLLTNNSAYYHGGGVAEGTLTNCLLTGNISNLGSGGGDYNARLTNCTLMFNYAAFEAGGGAEGCTLDNCLIATNSTATDGTGGGTAGGVLNQCLLIGNTADFGAGSREGVLNSCTLTFNKALKHGGGTFGGTLTNCLLANNEAYGNGGGTSSGTLDNCVLTGNRGTSGGGASQATLNNCLLVGNSAYHGGGAYYGWLYNCTVVSNSCLDVWGAGIERANAYNSIVYYNGKKNSDNYYDTQNFYYCCTIPFPGGGTGVGDFTNAPAFVDLAALNLRLQTDCPYINMGTNKFARGLLDLDGRPRFIDDIVDIGVYEFDPRVDPYFTAWLQYYRLSTDGSADYTDPDGDGLNNWQEWRCGTCPTNALSALCLLSAAPPGTNVTVSWQSAAGVTYFLERSTNLASPFTLLATDLIGQAGTSTYTDTNAAGTGPFFYHVGVTTP